MSEDRFSSLPDELIHHILSFSDARLAVQTSVLSKRWELIWTTLPCLNFIRGPLFSEKEFKLIDNFLSHRNHESEMLKLNLSFRFSPDPIPILVAKFMSYANSHNIQDLTFDIPILLGRDRVKLSTFSSTSIKKLKLSVDCGDLLESDCWDLPALTTLHLITFFPKILPKSCLICLRSLRTLSLEGFILPNSISLPSLATLYLSRCDLPTKNCEFPALSTLTLDDVKFPKNASEFFLALVNVRNLTLFIRGSIVDDCIINCAQLVNLEIDATSTIGISHPGKIIVSSPKILNFTSVGLFPIRFEVSELEKVNIKLGDITGYESTIPPSKRMKTYNRRVNDMLKTYYRRVIDMFPGLDGARILTLDLETIQALSAVLDFLVRSPPPFHNLKYMKVPPGYEESSMPTYLKCYLLGHSPKATIVTTLPQDELIPQTLPVCLTNLLPEKPLATPVAGAGNDQASSSRGGSDFGLWQGYEVNSEFLYLLDCIAKKYPETFDYITTNSKKLGTMKLNMLCTIVKAFTETSLTEVDTKMITEYSALFADLQRSFNVKWLVDRLNYIQQLRFPQPILDKLHAVDSSIDDAKSKLQDLQALRMKMITEIHRDVETMGTSLAVGYLGDDLFSGP